MRSARAHTAFAAGVQALRALSIPYNGSGDGYVSAISSMLASTDRSYSYFSATFGSTFNALREGM